VKVKTTSAGEAAALSIAFERPGQDPWSRARLETQAGTEIVRTALITTDGNPDPHLTLRTTAAFAGSVSEIQLIEDGAMHTFELADDRQGWTTLIASGPSGAAGFLPRGVAAVGPPDFALVVRQALGTVNPVSTDNLIFLTNRRQRFCFMVKAAAATTSVGHLRIVSGGSQVLGQSFPLSTAWQPHCVNQIHTPYTNTTVTFAGSDGAPSYLVDSIGVYADTNGDIGLPGELDPTPQ
jgi:hypothetical protein